MAIDRSELRRGLAETSEYLLSHHVPAEYYRCYAPTIFGRRVHVCARCSGIYPGIALGVAAALLGPPLPTGLLLVAVLPLPALVEWALTAMTDRRGYNAVRTITGAMLGYGYGLGLARLLSQGDRRVIAVGVAYALAAGTLLAVQRRRAAE